MTATPCSTSESPDDWFITSTGKQYVDDELVPQSLVDLAREEAVESERDPDVAESRLRTDAKVAALARRRHAKEACRECPMRLACLQHAISQGESQGTWGGYYEEEISTLRTEIERRRQR